MRTYSTNEARNKFAEIIDIARREPVAIAKHGRVVSIILAKEDYEHYQVIEQIGKGTFGNVYKIKRKVDDKVNLFPLKY